MTEPAGAGLASSTDFFGDARPATAPWSLAWFRRVIFYALVGTVLLLANFPTFLTKTVELNVADPKWQRALLVPVQVVQVVMAELIGDSPVDFFERAMTSAFLLFWLFLASMTLLCFRSRSLRMLLYAIGGAVIGYFVLHVMAWAAAATVATIGGALYVGRWVGGGIATITGFLLLYLWPLLAIAVLVGVYILRTQLLLGLLGLARFIRPYLVRIIGISFLIVVLVFLIPVLYRRVVQPVIEFVKGLLGPVFSGVASVVKWIVVAIVTVIVVAGAVAVGLLSLALLGSLLVSQLQAGWHAARSARHILIAGFAIGSSIGLIALVSVATPAVAEALNAAWQNVFVTLGLSEPNTTTSLVTDAFQVLLPSSVDRFVFAHLTSVQAPALDGLIFVVVIALALISVWLRLLSSQRAAVEAVPVRFVAQEFLKMALGSFVAVVMIFLAAASEESDT